MKFKIILLISIFHFQFSLASYVYWEPEIPIPGETIAIYYESIEGTLPNDADPVYIHLGYNGWQDVDDLEMTLQPELPDGNWWMYSYNIPENAETIDFVFTDLINWDNNGGYGIDWHISLNYSWTPFNPGPNDHVTINLNNVDMGGHIAWTVDAGNGHVTPINDYYPAGSYEEDGLVFTPLEFAGGETYQVIFDPFQSGAQVVQSIKFKILWENGEWDVGQNGQVMLYDIYFDYSPGDGDPQVEFTQPEQGSEVNSPVTLACDSDAEVVEFWISGIMVGEDSSAPFSTVWTPDPSVFGDITAIARAENSAGVVSYDFIDFYLQFSIINEAVPDWANDGVTVNGSDVIIALYAPFKDYVAVRGNWNLEYPNGELMKLSGDTLWWYQTELENGDYEYKFNLEGVKWIADPWSKNVNWQDAAGNESSNYQDAKTAFIIGGESFNWTDENYSTPPQDEIIIYEMHVGDFSGDENDNGDYLTLIEKIEEGYFDSLGITAIELMPLNEFEGGWSWGYNPSYYMAPESSYGSEDELKLLIDTAHEHNIAVLLDVVFNHMWGSAPLFQLYQPLDNWEYEDHNYEHCPYFQNQESEWGFKLQHWHEADGRSYRTWKYVLDALYYWVDEYHFDGFRFDVSWSMGWGGDGDGVSFYGNKLHEMYPEIILIAEEDNAGNINSSDFDAGWDFSFHHTLFDAIMGININIYDVADHLKVTSQGYSQPTGAVTYMESHDEQRMIYEAVSYQNMDLETAYKRSALSASLLFTSQGTPMIYHGQEFGQNSATGTSPHPLQWNNLDSEAGFDLYQNYRNVIQLRKAMPVLRGANMTFTKEDNSNKVLVYERVNNDEAVVVVANFNFNDQTATVEFPYDGWWYVLPGDDSLLVSGEESQVDLPGSTAIIFTSRYIPGLNDDPPNNLLTFRLGQNYPNPFNSNTVIPFFLSEPAEVSLKVFNLRGEEIRTLVKSKMVPGEYQAAWDGKNNLGKGTASGIYLIQFHAGVKTAVEQMVFLK